VVTKIGQLVATDGTVFVIDHFGSRGVAEEALDDYESALREEGSPSDVDGRADLAEEAI
jgi:hypothetical protein